MQGDKDRNVALVRWEVLMLWRLDAEVVRINRRGRGSGAAFYIIGGVERGVKNRGKALHKNTEDK